ncbi:MAG: chitobiase/beta-hexosaminidase C-terminal domain-containing protein, partial [Paramuribaculum sp.]|nr:chitobiase/beta-hexosaminidase C-terminal domain-containing protein [Paramuribaculum sp.]
MTVLLCCAGLVAECHGAVKTHVVIGVGGDYPAECNGMTVIPAGDVAGRSISVPDGFRILFSNGSVEQLPYVDQRFGYIKIYAGNEFRLTPMTGIKICSMRIYVKDDYSSGWKNISTGLPIDRVGSRYEWRGESAYPVNLCVNGSSGDYQHVAYFEIDYAPIVETPPGTEDPSDEEDIKPVVITPQTASPISPDQEISLSCETPNTRIYYTTDGSEPGDRSPVYMHPFTLSPSTGLIVRALAVTPRGQTATALRRYYLDRVESPVDFIINGCRNYETKIDCALRIAYGKGEYGYVATADTDDDTQYLLVKFPRGYEIPRPNTMIENVRGVCEYMLDQDGMMMISAPVATGECPNQLIPAKKKISSIGERHLNLYVKISDVTFTGEKFVDKEGYSILAEDIFGVVENDLKQR